MTLTCSPSAGRTRPLEDTRAALQQRLVLRLFSHDLTALQPKRAEVAHAFPELNQPRRVKPWRP